MKQLLILAYTVILGCLPLLASAQSSHGRVMPPVYNFNNQDTLQFFNEYARHLAMIKEGNDLVVLDGVYTDFYDNKNPSTGGFQLSRYTLSGGKLTQTKKGTPAVKPFPRNLRYAATMNYNTFAKTETGYMACGPHTLAFFNKDLEPTTVFTMDGHAFISAAPLKGETQIALLEVSMANRMIYLNIFDYAKSKWFRVRPLPIYDGGDWLFINAQANRVVETPDGNLLVMLHPGTMDETYSHEQEFNTQIFEKLDMEKVRFDEDLDESRLWEKKYNVLLADFQMDAQGMMHAVVRMPGESDNAEKLQKVQADTKAMTGEEFGTSIQVKTMQNWNDAPRSGVMVRQLGNGKVLALGRGGENVNLSRTICINYFSPEMELIRRYAVKHYRRFKDEMYSKNWAPVTRPHQMAYFAIESDSDFENEGLYCLPKQDLNKLSTSCFEAHYGNQAVWDVVEGFEKDELLILTGFAILRVNLEKFMQGNVEPN